MMGLLLSRPDVAINHILNSSMGMSINFSPPNFADNPHYEIHQRLSTHHQLTIMTSPMKIRAIEFRASNPIPHPFEEHIVTDVHFDYDLRLTAIPTKMALADQEANNDPLIELRHARTRFFHKSLQCFTINIPV